MALNKPPGPDGTPVIGNLVPFLQDRLDFIETCAEEYDGVVHRKIGLKESYLVTEPGYIERVLVDDDHKTSKVDFGGWDIEQSCGNVVLDPSAHPWEQRLQNMAPSFTGEKINSYTPAMTESSVQKAEEWSAGEVVNVEEEMKDLILDITVNSFFGKGTVEDGRTLSEAFATVSDRYDPGTKGIPHWVPTPRNREFKQSLEFLFDVVDEMIEERRNAEEQRDDLLGLLVAAEASADGTVSSEYLRNELLTMLGAAHETSALAMTFVWYLLGRHPEADEKLHAEVDSVLDGEGPRYDDLDDLPYTGQVVKEALRLYPPIYSIGRELDAEVTLGDYTIPSGSRVFVSQWAVHRNGRFFDSPDEFRPERWTEEFEEELPEYAYFPFSGGPKRCLGWRFATIELQLILATMIQQVGLEPTTDEPIELKTGLTLKPASDVEMRVKTR